MQKNEFTSANSSADSFINSAKLISRCLASISDTSRDLNVLLSTLTSSSKSFNFLLRNREKCLEKTARDVMKIKNLLLLTLQRYRLFLRFFLNRPRTRPLFGRLHHNVCRLIRPRFELPVLVFQDRLF